MNRVRRWLSVESSPAKLWEMLGTSHWQRALRLAMLLSVVLGLYLRVRLYAIRPSTLWEDEAYWAWKTLTLPVLTQTFRPPGFLLITKGLVTWLGPSELTFRALPFLASLAGLLTTPYVAKRSFRSDVTRLVVVALMAVHPAALTMSVEFKQYGVELGVFVVLLAAYLHYRERPGPRSLGLLLLLAWLGFFFSIIIIFLYPALFGVLLWDAAKSKKLRVLAVTGGAALLCVATIVTIYFTTWRHFNEGKAEKRWGDKYGVFYVPNEQQSRAAWTLKKYADVASLPGYGRLRWKTDELSADSLERLVSVDRTFWLVLHVVGIAWLLWRRRLREAAWLWSPLLVMLVFNWVGRWPAGAFRTNAGIVPFTIFLAAYGLEALTELRARIARLLLPVGALLALGPTFVMRPDWFQKGAFARPGRFDEVFDALLKTPRRSGRQQVLMDNSSCRPWRYYSGYDARTAKTTAPQITKRFTGRCVGSVGALSKSIAQNARQGRDTWVVLTDRRRDAAVEAATARACASVTRTAVGEGLHVLWHCESGSKRN